MQSQDLHKATQLDLKAICGEILQIIFQMIDKETAQVFIDVYYKDAC